MDKNFTVSFPVDLLKDGKILAARCDTSLNSLLRELLRAAVERQAQGAPAESYLTLIRFSLGQIDREQAKTALGMEGDVPFFLTLAAAGLSVPALPEKDLTKMVDDFVRVMEAVS